MAKKAKLVQYTEEKNVFFLIFELGLRGQLSGLAPFPKPTMSLLIGLTKFLTRTGTLSREDQPMPPIYVTM